MRLGYWIEYQKGEYSLKSKTVSIKEKRQVTNSIPYGDDIAAFIEVVYQPVYETYQAGEVLLDRSGNPIPVMERVYMYEDQEQTVEREKLVSLDAVYEHSLVLIQSILLMIWIGVGQQMR